MKVIIATRQGYVTREGLEFASGAIADLDEHLALKLIRYGIARPAPVVETAAKVAPVQNEAKRTGKTTKKTVKAIVPEGGEAE